MARCNLCGSGGLATLHMHCVYKHLMRSEKVKQDGGSGYVEYCTVVEALFNEVVTARKLRFPVEI